MAECVRERPKAKKKKTTNIRKNESRPTPKTGYICFFVIAYYIVLKDIVCQNLIHFELVD